ncbi:MAG: hypothetical protein HWN81_10895 [Candidatus Lokiarchaeota archaeon]|nr:hypothetical protein [Candidatus Lokiarchaeota archaeon]
MRFITGLKNLSKKTILIIIVFIFIISWFLFIFSRLVISNPTFSGIIAFFIAFLAGFTFVLLILSLFFNLDKRGTFCVITAIVLTIPVILIFTRFIWRFFIFCFFANLVITAFFAFKFCIDTSTTVDDYLYRKKSSRKFTRVLEFIVFLILNVVFVFVTIRFFRNSSNPVIQGLANFLISIDIILIVIDVILFVFIIFRLIFTKKFSAYISFFYLLIFIYMLYVVISLSADFIFYDPFYNLLSFFIDFFIFLYLIGSIFERVEYIKDQIKILGADTIALFVILMKSIVQIINILVDLNIFTLAQIGGLLLIQALVLLICIALFSLLIGLYTIFAHKEGKNL